MSRPADERAVVYARIREALRTPAPHFHGVEPKAGDTLPTEEAFRAWLPLVGPTQAEQVALFEKNSAALKTEVYEVGSLAEAAAQLGEIAKEAGWKQVATHNDPLASGLSGKLGLPILTTEAGYDTLELEKCDAGITGCDALVAQTGSILVSTMSAGGRALSVLPPHHVVIARREKMVPDLASALRLVRDRYAPNWPSCLSFITGPSRTGDIERILVLGAHGPKRLTVFLLP